MMLVVRIGSSSALGGGFAQVSSGAGRRCRGSPHQVRERLPRATGAPCGYLIWRWFAGTIDGPVQELDRLTPGVGKPRRASPFRTRPMKIAPVSAKPLYEKLSIPLH